MNESGDSVGPARGALGRRPRPRGRRPRRDRPALRHGSRSRTGRRAGGPQRPQVAEAGPRQRRLPPRPRGRGPPRHHRPRDRLRARAGPLRETTRRGARADRARGRRARPARRPAPLHRIGREPRGAPGGRSACSDSSSHTPSTTTPVARSSRPRAREPQRAFVSASLRPYLLATLLDAEPERPALVVAGDDRAARDLAADLKAFLAPAPVRFYPARGVRYESHLAPPPHLVGLRIAALDALLAAGRGAGRARRPRARGARREGARPRPAPARLRDREGRPARPRGDRRRSSWPAATSASTRCEERGQFAIRGDILDVYPATEERAVRCELFDVEVERLTFFSTFTQRSLEEVERVEIAPAAELAPEHRELAEIAAASEEDERPDVAEVLPVDRFRELLELVPRGRARGGRRGGGAGAGAARLLGGRDHELPRQRRPPPLRQAGARSTRRSTSAPRSACRASPGTSRTSSAPRPRTPPRARCATPSPSSRSSCARATAPWWPGRAGARPSARSSTWPACRPPFLDGQPGAGGAGR